MKRLLILLLLFLPLVACYGNNKIEEDNVFACTSNSECLDNFECKQGFCVGVEAATSAVPVCVDGDTDGYGGAGTSDAGYLKCISCSKKQLCAKDQALDCDDNDSSVHPGAFEFCDGKDNDCNGTPDDLKLGNCPTGAAIECGESPDSNLVFSCDFATKKCSLKYKGCPVDGCSGGNYKPVDPSVPACASI